MNSAEWQAPCWWWGEREGKQGEMRQRRFSYESRIVVWTINPFLVAKAFVFCFWCSLLSFWTSCRPLLSTYLLHKKSFPVLHHSPLQQEDHVSFLGEECSSLTYKSTNSVLLMAICGVFPKYKFHGITSFWRVTFFSLKTITKVS